MNVIIIGSQSEPIGVENLHVKLFCTYLETLEQKNGSHWVCTMGVGKGAGGTNIKVRSKKALLEPKVNQPLV